MSYVIHTTGNGAKGDTGRVGQTGGRGVKGNKGDDGKSAYEIWLDCGNTGTEQDFIDSLRGADGNDGINASIGSSITIANIYFTTSNMTTTIPFECGNNGLVCGGNFTVSGFLQVSSHTMSDTHTLAGIAAYTEDGTLLTFPTFPSDTKLSNLNGLWGLNKSGAFVTNSGSVGHMVYWGTAYTLSNCSALTFNNIGASDEYIGFTKMMMMGSSIVFGTSGTVIDVASITTSDIYASTIYTKTLYASKSIAYNGSDSSALFTYPNIATSYLMTQRIGEVRESGPIIEASINGYDYNTNRYVSKGGYNISLFGNEIKIGTAYTESIGMGDNGSSATSTPAYRIAQNTSVGILGDVIDIGQDQWYTVYGMNNSFAYNYISRTFPYSEISLIGSRPYSFIYTKQHRTSAINLLASDVNIGTGQYTRGTHSVEDIRTNVNIIGLLNLLYHTTNMSIDANGFVNNNGLSIGNRLTAKLMVSSYTKRDIVESTYTITTPTSGDTPNVEPINYLKYSDVSGNYLGIYFTYKNTNTTTSSKTINWFYPLFSIDGLSRTLGTITPINNITLTVKRVSLGHTTFPIISPIVETQTGCDVIVKGKDDVTIIEMGDYSNNISTETASGLFSISVNPDTQSGFEFKGISIGGTSYTPSQFSIQSNGWYVLNNVNIGNDTTIQINLQKQLHL